MAATFNYTLNGAEGSMNLSRFNIATIHPDGNYGGAFILNASGCSNSNDNGTVSDFSLINVVTSGSQIALAQTYSSGLICNYTGTYSQLGTKYLASGSFTCPTNGYGGSWATNDLSIHDVFLSGQMGLTYTSGESCNVVVDIAMFNATQTPAASKFAKRRSNLVQ